MALCWPHIHIYFRMHNFVVRFLKCSLPQVARGALTPRNQNPVDVSDCAPSSDPTPTVPLWVWWGCTPLQNYGTKFKKIRDYVSRNWQYTVLPYHSGTTFGATSTVVVTIFFGTAPQFCCSLIDSSLYEIIIWIMYTVSAPLNNFYSGLKAVGFTLLCS